MPFVLHHTSTQSTGLAAASCGQASNPSVQPLVSAQLHMTNDTPALPQLTAGCFIAGGLLAKGCVISLSGGSKRGDSLAGQPVFALVCHLLLHPKPSIHPTA